MKDYRKFCRPKTIKNPSAGDYEITLNCGNKVYVEKHEFERKLDKFFKNYLVVADHDYSQDYLTFEALEEGTFTFPDYLSYSLDGGSTWTDLDPDTNTPSIAVGNEICFKAALAPSYNGPGSFSATGNFNAKGNPMSLLFWDDFAEYTSFGDKNMAGLFKNNTKLISAEYLSLPATLLEQNFYYEMFKGCTSLTTAPELPAMTLASGCYSNMFYGCTSLTTAPSLPATTLADYCYQSMFWGCTSLTTAPELPVMTLKSNCYTYMFRDCTGLTTAPTLPATTLTPSCYSNMFNGCTSLTTAPELPATTLAISCYYDMFMNCTSLTTAPTLPATRLAQSCYLEMFKGCTSLTTAPELLATTLANQCCRGMFYGCTSLTTAPSELPATTLTTQCYSNMFWGCTSLTTAPELPATTLAEDCYESMFYGCTSLTTAPELPATTLMSGCYRCMFSDCSSLNYIKAVFTTTPNKNYTGYWVDGVAASGTFVKNSAAIWTTTGENGVPSGWTVETESGHKYVNLGLPSGLLWADRNVGADAPEDFGLYFSWGNTDGHEEGSGYDFSDANYNASPGKQISGDIALSQDAANAYLGGLFRMPTKDEFQELYDNCDSAWVTENGVAGCRFTSKTNGNSIFFPTAGNYNGTTLYSRGSRGSYWSASRDSDSYGYYLVFGSGFVYPQEYDTRSYGFSVRAVQ